MKILYETKAKAFGGKDGEIHSLDGVLNLDMAAPVELGGKGGPYTNPEQIFAAGFAACFDSSLHYAARNHKITLENSSVTATVGVGLQEGGKFQFEVWLEVSLPGVDENTAAELIEIAHQVCPYSNASTGNIDIHVVVVN